jgi:hypothetical protein
MWIIRTSYGAPVIDIRQLKVLQAQARSCGRVCNFFYTDKGLMDGVFYMDSKASPKSRSHSGMILDPLSFAEIEASKSNFETIRHQRCNDPLGKQVTEHFYPSESQE